MTKDNRHAPLIVVLLVAATVCSTRNAWSGQGVSAQARRQCAGLEPYQKEIYRVDVRKWREDILEVAGVMDRRADLMPNKAPQQFDDVKKIDQMIASTPSQFEDPGSYHLLSLLVADVERARSALALPLATQPCFGTLPIQTVNASAARVEGDTRPYIVVNRSLFTFVHEMTKLALLTVKFSRAEPPALLTMEFGPAAYEHQLSVYPELRERMAALVSMFIGGPPPPPLRLGREYDPLLVAADEGAELFAVAHEYAHLIHKHLESAKINEMQLLTNRSGPTVPRAYIHTWLQEIDADLTALKLTEKALDLRHSQEPRSPLNIATEFSRRAPLLFLRYSDIVRDALDIRVNGQLPEPNDALVARQIDALKRARLADGDQVTVPGTSNEAHPPAPVRIAFIRENVKGWERLPTVEPTVDENAFVGLAEALDRGIQRLWKESRLLILDSRDDSKVTTEAGPVQVFLTEPSDLNSLVLAIGLPGSPSKSETNVTLIFVNQGKECTVPAVSTVRFISQDGVTVARPAARLSQEKDAETCTEGVAAILRSSEALLLTKVSTLTIEFAGRQIALSATQLQDFRRGLDGVRKQ